MRVAVLGASTDPEKYAHLAQTRLMAAGHEVVPVTPLEPSVLGVTTTPSLQDIKGAVDIVTVYVGPKRLAGMADDLLALAPKKVIFNPGAESEAVEKQLAAAGIASERACTLVLLSTGQFGL